MGFAGIWLGSFNTLPKSTEVINRLHLCQQVNCRVSSFDRAVKSASSREDTCNNGADDGWHDEDANCEAQGAADEQAAVAVNLAAHRRAHQLFEHDAGV